MDLEKRYKFKAKDAAILDEENVLFFSADINVIYTVNIHSGETKYWGYLPEEETFEKNLCSAVYRWKDKLIFAPMAAKKLWIYHISDSTWHGIEIAENEHANMDIKFSQIHEYNGKVYLVGMQYPALLCMNLETEEAEYITTPYDDYIELKKKLNDCYFRNDAVLKDGHLYLASCLCNILFDINLSDYVCREIELGGPDYRYSGVTEKDNKFYLAPRHGTPIVCYDSINGQVSQMPLPESIQHDNYTFLGITEWKEGFVLPAMGIDTTLYISNDLQITDIQKQRYFLFKKMSKNLTVYIDHTVRVGIEKDSAVVSTIPELSVAELKKGRDIDWTLNFVAYCFNKYSYLTENENVTLEDYINYISRHSEKEEVVDEQCGTGIWRHAHADEA